MKIKRGILDALRHALELAHNAIFAPKADLKDVFSAFKEVLENNNRSLEVITDMGEKLGGDYIFDIVYVRDSYSKLSQSMETSIAKFDRLTREHYKIRDAFERIDLIIRRVVDESGHAAAPAVSPLDGIKGTLYEEIGGKAANLARLKNELMLNVPDGFVLTAKAYDMFMRHNGIAPMLDPIDFNSLPPGGTSALRSAIMSGSLPGEIEIELSKCINNMRKAAPGLLAVRSSAGEEDSELSFAGQFETVLNVPMEAAAISDAYRRVLASMFSDSACAYAKRSGLPIGGMKMSVACIRMVDAKSAGVLYTSDPSDGSDRIVINSVWGLGSQVVDGAVDADLFVVSKKPPFETERLKTGSKLSMGVLKDGGGTMVHETPAGLRAEPSLTDAQVRRLAEVSLKIEKHYRSPQDIEWAVDSKGDLFILQSRPLRVNANSPVVPLDTDVQTAPIFKDSGLVVQRGAAAGRVFMLEDMGDIENIPKGSVLVAKNDSPQFVRAMPYVSAIITDTGAVASHMASICREFRIPTIVNAKAATGTLKHGQEITLVVSDENSFAVYDGQVPGLALKMKKSMPAMEELYEFRKKKYIMRYIAPLNLINPLTDDFSPEKCRTLHDVLRFMHEKAVQALISASTNAARKSAPRKLELSVPAGIQVIDIGGGLSADTGDTATLDDITCAPLKAVARGMASPGAWRSDAVALNTSDFLSSMMRMDDITVDSSKFSAVNFAVISREYLNLSLRFGYHFNMLDCYCSEKAANNHIYFRFMGGATDITKRTRRIQLIAEILKEFGFIMNAKGDLIIARLSHINAEEVLRILESLGKLIAYARQLDAVLNQDSDIAGHKSIFFGIK